MAMNSPRVRASLRSLTAAADSSWHDPVTVWKARVRAGASAERQAAALNLAHATAQAVRALPLAPFRRAAALARRIPRRASALVFGGVAVGAAVGILELPKNPLVTFALVALALSAIRAAHRALDEASDQRSGIAGTISQASEALASGNAERAIALVRAALERARCPDHRRALWRTLAWSGIAQRDPFLSHLALQQLPPEDMDLHLLSSYLACCNRCTEAEELLREARADGYRSPETSKLLIELLFARGDHAGALALCEADSQLLSVQERRAVESALADLRSL
jgi:hypothetical protein